MKREQAEQIYLKCRYWTRKLTGDVEMAIAVDAVMEAVAIEREACAMVCESFDTCDPRHIAKAIRARGEIGRAMK